VNGREDRRQRVRKEQLAAIPGDAKGAAEESLGGGGAEADDHLGLHLVELGIEPGTAGGDFVNAGSLVNAPFTARLPLEVLDRVGQVDIVATNAGVGEAAVEKKTGGTDKRHAFLIFAVAGLFADEDETGLRASRAEDGLRGVLEEGASLAVASGLLQRLEIAALRQERSGGEVFCGLACVSWCGFRRR